MFAKFHTIEGAKKNYLSAESSTDTLLHKMETPSEGQKVELSLNIFTTLLQEINDT